MPELILDMLERLRDDAPDAVAVELLHARREGGFTSQPVTRAAWLSAAASCASALSALGVRRGDRVLLCLPTSAAFLEVFLGALWLGALPVPLPSLEGFLRHKPFLSRIDRVVASAQPKLMVADPHTAQALRGRAVVLPAALHGEPILRAPLAPDDPAFLQYTSGSTGDPRGVVVTHGNLAANVRALAAALQLSPADRQVTWLPLYHDMGMVGGLLTTATHGVVTSLLPPIEFLLRPATWLEAVSARRATLTVAPNFAYSMLARKVPEQDLAGLELSSLRAAVNGAEPIDPGTADAFARRFAPYGFRRQSFLPVYGLAEATLCATASALGRCCVVDEVDREALAVERVARPSSGGARYVSVGRAIPGHAVAIVDPDTGAELPERHAGEIVVRGPSVSPGYFGEPPRRTPDARTGDLGYLAGGELYVVDRLKDLVLVAGRGYAPSEIERAAEEVAGIRRGRVAAFSVPDETAGTEQLVVVAESRGAPAPELEEAVASSVADGVGLAPQRVLVVGPGDLSRTSSGKIRRGAARARYLAGELRPPPRWKRFLRALQGM